jgi:betaine-aldehyde dehydrogenase
MEELKLYIHGKLVEATSNESFDNINPATGEVISKVQAASKADVDRAVESARDGFRVWSRMTGATWRRRIEMKIAREKHRRHVPPPPSWVGLFSRAKTESS